MEGMTDECQTENEKKTASIDLDRSQQPGTRNSRRNLDFDLNHPD
jgi:hypothetical protein